MKKISFYFLMIFLGAVCTFSLCLAASKEVPKKVLVSQIAEHPALDRTVEGILVGLEQEGFKRNDNLEFRVESAQARSDLAAQIASKFVHQNPDIVVGVGTLAAQNFVKYAKDGLVKFVFSSVTDPLGAQLVESLSNPGNNTSGVSNFVDLEPQIKLFQTLQPSLKRLGLLYNPGEFNSVSIVGRIKDICAKEGLTLVEQIAYKTSDVAQAATKLSASVDAIFISNDSTALSAFSSILKAASQAKIPVYVSDVDILDQGALAALGPDQYDIGIQTGRMIARGLRGEDLATLTVEFPNKTDLYINLEKARLLGISVPNDLIKKATLIEKGGV